MSNKSDCAVHNMPAKPNGPCDCGADANAALVAKLTASGGFKVFDAEAEFEAALIAAERRGRVAGLRDAADYGENKILSGKPFFWDELRARANALEASE